ncbi:hypothetical protein KPH14_010757 [Odynerus spinipes]|uniref:snRNA-activating protein complex subunit 1 n=1 Tax=Odynerus spinipes TaxID=1348599 RepID=A0AAD9RFR3_9HYME|nr:hypothetical protein KPH14_010757 [Odynerus spinipes]
MNTRSYVSAGFQEDCAKLINRFEQAEDVRFQTFSEIWKDLKFSLIFKGKRTTADLMEFCEDILYISKQYLFSTRFKERICGLYLLYGIYYKMPFTLFKIRIKLTDWHSIMELHNQIKEGEHLDANYILSKLIVDNAFQHCLFDLDFSFERGFREKTTRSDNPYSFLTPLKNITEKNQLFAKISALSNIYQQSKSEASTSNTRNCNLNLFNHNFVNDIINDIHKLEKDRQAEQKMSKSNASKKIAKKTQKPVQGAKEKCKQRQKDSHNTHSEEPDSESSSDEFAE